MTETDKLNDWLSLYRVSLSPIRTLCAIYENDGERMLNAALKKLGLASVSELVKAQSEADKKLR